MYWYWYHNYNADAKLVFSTGERMPTARKEHQCCECDRIIQVGEKYSYFAGRWEDDISSCRRNGRLIVRKTCLKCDQDWKTILRVFRENSLEELDRVYGSLQQAVQDAFDNDLLTEDDQLVKDWLYLEKDLESLSPDQLKEYEERKALAEKRKTLVEMKTYSCPLL